MPPLVKNNLNFNTYLIAIVVALSGWTLKKVTDMAEHQAATAQVDAQQTKAIEALDQRVNKNTVDIVELRVKIGK